MKLSDLRLPLSQLLLDPNNYRLDYDSSPAEIPDEEIEALQYETQERLEKEKLGELRESILANGFLEMDRIVVRKLNVKRDKRQLYVVVEGNRRTAALKGLLEDYLEGVVNLSSELKKKVKAIGVVCIEAPPDEIEDVIAGLMGIRHVSGPKRWTGYQSARLINDMTEKGKKVAEIGSLLGISASEVGRRLRGYKALIQMRDDSEYGAKARQKHYTLLLEFTGSIQTGRTWLDWDDKSKRFENQGHLERVYRAITPDEKGKRPEINNPTDAREFIRLLSSDKHRKRIESGTPFQSLSHRTNEESLAKFVDFLSILDDPSDDDIEKLAEIFELVKEKIDNFNGELS